MVIECSQDSRVAALGSDTQHERDCGRPVEQIGFGMGGYRAASHSGHPLMGSIPLLCTGAGTNDVEEGCAKSTESQGLSLSGGESALGNVPKDVGHRTPFPFLASQEREACRARRRQVRSCSGPMPTARLWCMCSSDSTTMLIFASAGNAMR